jgi:hypothetical protein
MELHHPITSFRAQRLRFHHFPLPVSHHRNLRYHGILISSGIGPLSLLTRTILAAVLAAVQLLACRAMPHLEALRAKLRLTCGNGTLTANDEAAADTAATHAALRFTMRQQSRSMRQSSTSCFRNSTSFGASKRPVTCRIKPWSGYRQRSEYAAT